MTDEDNTPDKTSFINGLFLTHQRIHDCLNDAAYYKINGNPIGTKENLKNVYITVFGLLNKKELVEAKKLWSEVEQHKIKINNYNLTFNDDIWADLDNFNFFINKVLVKHSITFSTRGESSGLNAVYKKYNLKDEETEI